MLTGILLMTAVMERCSVVVSPWKRESVGRMVCRMEWLMRVLSYPPSVSVDCPYGQWSNWGRCW